MSGRSRRVGGVKKDETTRIGKNGEREEDQ